MYARSLVVSIELIIVNSMFFSIVYHRSHRQENRFKNLNRNQSICQSDEIFDDESNSIFSAKLIDEQQNTLRDDE